MRAISNKCKTVRIMGEGQGAGVGHTERFGSSLSKACPRIVGELEIRGSDAHHSSPDKHLDGRRHRGRDTVRICDV
jgi:hypothetical protein